MKMYKICNFIVAGAMLVSTAVTAGELNSSEQNVVFSSSDGENEVSISFSGKWGGEPITIVGDGKSDDPYSAFIREVIKQNRTGKVENMLSVWEKDEHEHLRKEMKKKKARQHNTRLYKRIGDSWLYGLVEYGRYRICVVVHEVSGADPFVKKYPVTKVKSDEFKLTNDLSEDYVFYELITNLANHYHENKWKNQIMGKK